MPTNVAAATTSFSSLQKDGRPVKQNFHTEKSVEENFEKIVVFVKKNVQNLRFRFKFIQNSSFFHPKYCQKNSKFRIRLPMCLVRGC